MIILSLETSGLQGSIALHLPGETVCQPLATEGRRHAQTLTLEIHDLLKRYSVRPDQLQAIAVSLGPGSFTGLRVGLVCAKTLAYALKCKLIGVETFLSIAAAAPVDVKSLWVISDAQRGDFFAAHYSRGTDNSWTIDQPLTIVPACSWLKERTSNDLLAGPGVTKILADQTAAHVFRDSWSVQPSAEQIGRLAAVRLLQDESDDPWTLGPVYFRPSAAEEQFDRKKSSSKDIAAPILPPASGSV